MKDTNIMFGLMKACHFELAKKPPAGSWMAGLGMSIQRCEMRQKQCEVKENCKNYLMGRGNCWYCTDYSQYIPEDKRILCQRQIRRREEKKITKKNGQHSQASKLGRRSKKKGYEGEREVVNLLRKYGIKAERVPLSGALKSQKYSCDVALGNGKRIEVKRRKSGMKTIQKWLEEDKYSNYVFFREDGDTDGWIVIMPYMEFIELMQGGS